MRAWPTPFWVRPPAGWLSGWLPLPPPAVDHSGQSTGLLGMCVAPRRTYTCHLLLRLLALRSPHAGVLGEPVVDSCDPDILDEEPMDRVQVRIFCIFSDDWLGGQAHCKLWLPAVLVCPMQPRSHAPQPTDTTKSALPRRLPVQIMLEDAQRLHNLWP